MPELKVRKKNQVKVLCEEGCGMAMTAHIKKGKLSPERCPDCEEFLVICEDFPGMTGSESYFAGYIEEV